jgi:hypothetical protein
LVELESNLRIVHDMQRCWQFNRPSLHMTRVILVIKV